MCTCLSSGPQTVCGHFGEHSDFGGREAEHQDFSQWIIHTTQQQIHDQPLMGDLRVGWSVVHFQHLLPVTWWRLFPPVGTVSMNFVCLCVSVHAAYALLWGDCDQLPADRCGVLCDRLCQASLLQSHPEWSSVCLHQPPTQKLTYVWLQTCSHG